MRPLDQSGSPRTLMVPFPRQEADQREISLTVTERTAANARFEGRDQTREEREDASTRQVKLPLVYRVRTYVEAHV